MHHNRRPYTVSRVFAFAFWTALLAGNASGMTGHSVFFFDYENGISAGITIDAAGDIWGTSSFGDAYGYGNVFELTRDSAGSGLKPCSTVSQTAMTAGSHRTQTDHSSIQREISMARRLEVVCRMAAGLSSN